MCLSLTLFSTRGCQNMLFQWLTVFPKMVSSITSFRRLFPQITSLVALASYAGLDSSWHLNFRMENNLFSSQVYITIVGCFVSHVILIWAYFLIFYVVFGCNLMSPLHPGSLSRRLTAIEMLIFIKIMTDFLWEVNVGIIKGPNAEQHLLIPLVLDR